MVDMLTQSVFFGVFLSLVAYEVGLLCRRRWKLAVLNPLLIAICLTILLLAVCGIDYADYNAGAKYLSYLLTPATICLAIPLYEQFGRLKENWRAVLAGIVSGVVTSCLLVLALAVLFGLSYAEYVTFLPKSITTAIGIGVSEQLGGYVSVTVTSIIITGVLGNIIAEPVCRLFRITDPVAKGIGIGSASHAIGTARAMEMGEVEGAMSGLSIAVSGILTVLAAAVFSAVY